MIRKTDVNHHPVLLFRSSSKILPGTALYLHNSKLNIQNEYYQHFLAFQKNTILTRKIYNLFILNNYFNFGTKSL